MSARKNAVGAVSAKDEEEDTIGSRVYLPSRSEQEMDAPFSASAAASARSSSFDPDERPEEFIIDLDIDTKQSIRNLGWKFALKADIARQMRGNGAGAAGQVKLAPSDIGSEDLVLESVILDKNGEPTERWTISGRQWVGDYPTRYPDGWLSEMLVYPDDTPISPSDMVDELRKTRKPLNWVISIIALMEKYARRKLKMKTESESVAMAENVRNIETNTNETQRVSGEIDRAKREGNVAEEERLKVQMARLVDERLKYDAIRREMEGDPDYVPMSPEYTSSTPTGGEADVANQVRRAVGSFNAKMLDKYGENDQDIPESDGYSPRAPSSPAYSSIFENDDGQSGGGGGGKNIRRGSGGKYIPQIPMGVLENYLSSKYGQTGVSMTGTGGMMTGGGVGSNNAATMGLPTMNIPVVATMPMAGMMPIQQGGNGSNNGLALQQGQTPQQPQPQPQNGQNGDKQFGGGGGPEPNAQGVKTFSIKL
jgi:hypothetical protein